MKTAISIPDQVFESAEELASKLGKSRSQLYVQALTTYIEQYNRGNVTKELNAIFDNIDSTLDPVIRNLQSRSLLKDKW